MNPTRRALKTVAAAATFGVLLPAFAGATLFDFDSAPLHTSLPVSVTADGITATLTGSGQSFSIQYANALGFTPAGFAGYCVYPNSVYLADLTVTFSQAVTTFSLMYAPEEYACDSSARMRATAYMNNTYVGTNTTTADPPGTWPTGTLTFSSTQGFDKVVVHYDAAPPTGGDWGPIFMADNMEVTAMTPVAVGGPVGVAPAFLISPNPFQGQVTLQFTQSRPEPASVTIHDAAGDDVRTLAAGAELGPDGHTFTWDGRDDRGLPVAVGIYFVRADVDGHRVTRRIVLVR